MKSYYFLINSLENGGAERVISLLANALTKEKNKITIITLKPSQTFYEIENCKIIALSSIQNNFLLFFSIPFFVYRLRKIFATHDFNNGVSFLEIANFVHILSKKNAIISFRTTISIFQGLIGKIYKILIKILYPKAGTIIVNSKENASLLYNYLFGTKAISTPQILTIYNPVYKSQENKARTMEIKEKYNLNNKKIFITVGTIRFPDQIGTKNHHRIIDALSRLDRNDDSWRLLIIGDGPAKSSIKDIIVKKKLDTKVHLVGRKSDVFSYLYTADYFLYASPKEGFPNAVLEAMAVGLPILTTHFYTGARELLNIKTKDVAHPLISTHGILFSLENFEKEFLGIYKDLENYKFKQGTLDEFDQNYISKQWKTIFDK